MFPLFKGTDFWEKLSTEIIREQNRSQIKTVNGLDVIDFHGIKFLRFFSALIFDVKFAHDSCTNIYFWTRDEAIQKTILSKISNYFCVGKLQENYLPTVLTRPIIYLKMPQFGYELTWKCLRLNMNSRESALVWTWIYLQVPQLRYECL